MVVSAISVALGATRPAVTLQGIGVRLSTVGLIPLLIGTAGLVVPAMVISWYLSSDKHHRTLDRQVIDLRGGLRSIHRESRRLTQRVMSLTTRPPCQILPVRGTSDCRNRNSMYASETKEHTPHQILIESLTAP
jgi:hypothetical protein